jgi:hypothetical protein
LRLLVVALVTCDLASGATAETFPDVIGKDACTGF